MRLKFKMRKSSWVILVGFVMLALLDFISTFSVGGAVEYLEANPVYLYFGWPLLISLNILMVYILLRFYDSNNPSVSFSALNGFVWLCVIRIAVIINNFKTAGEVAAGKVDMQAIMQVPTEVKVAHYYNYMWLGLALPLFITMVVFILYMLDHKVGWNDLHN